MIKKLLLIFAVAVCAASCLDSDTTYSTSYTLDATFEYGNVFQSDSLFFDMQSGVGLGWKDMAFYHKLDKDNKEFLGGFILSCLKGKGESEDDRFRVNSGRGYGESSNYMVYYINPDESKMPEKDVEFLSSKYGTCTMAGCYVNNTKEVAEAVRNSFVDGDRLSIKMTGYLDGKVTASQEFVLAEYNVLKDSLVTTWSPFQLDKLGMIEHIDIEIISTRDDIPKAFCLDDMIAKVSVAY